MENFTAKAEITINAPASKVWEALVTPAIIKQYMFGTDTVSDFKVGSSITYSGEWEGKKYQDKGQILEIEPERKMVATYWSSMSGQPDVPENYMKITQELVEQDGKTTLTITQENAKSQSSADHSGENWKMVLAKIKEICEK